MAKYYIQHKLKLLKDFNRVMKKSKNSLFPYFGEEKTENIILESQEEFEALITILPHIGGKKNYNTDYLIKSAWFLAVFNVLKRHGKSKEEIGEISHLMTEAYLDSYPQFLLRIRGRLEFTWYNKYRLKKQAQKSQKRKYPEDWVFTFVEGNGNDFDFGLDYAECGICKFFQKQKAEEFIPLVCQADFHISKRYGTGLMRTKTIVEGYQYCNSRFKKDR
ncbi:L-2-amino-thiazoline-4-carboxylic acid hydrolase [Methanobacterium oryzae]|uniref:L-2-amino-thiazoline-4-carboxylic acid hydrolase n=1 Tax=Methanobacterium oryzae TaxID=69540 RepID=UPI003D1DD370